MKPANYNKRELWYLNYNRNIKKISSIIPKMLKDTGLSAGIKEAKIKKLLPKLLGNDWIEEISKIQVINNKLYITVITPSLKQELFLQKTQLLQVMNELYQTDLEEIIIL